MLPSIVISPYKATSYYEETAAPTCGTSEEDKITNETIDTENKTIDNEKELEQLDNACGKNGLFSSCCHWTSCFVLCCTSCTAVQLWGHVRDVHEFWLYAMLIFVLSLYIIQYVLLNYSDYDIARYAPIVAFVLSIVTFGLVFRSRRALREKWKGNVNFAAPKKWGTDFCVVFCCNWCAICQMFALTKIRKNYVPFAGIRV
jgi:hypothetical protein